MVISLIHWQLTEEEAREIEEEKKGYKEESVPEEKPHPPSSEEKSDATKNVCSDLIVLWVVLGDGVLGDGRRRLRGVVILMTSQQKGNSSQTQVMELTCLTTNGRRWVSGLACVQITLFSLSLFTDSSRSWGECSATVVIQTSWSPTNCYWYLFTQIRVPTGLSVPIKSRDVIVDIQKQVRPALLLLS